MMKTEREFKLKVYPSLGFSIIFPFIFLFNFLREKGLSGIASSRLYLVIYFCALILPSVIIMIKYSGNYKGAFVFLNMMLYVVICFKAFKKSLPFSEAFGTAQQGEGLIIIPVMILLGVLALVHYFSTKFNFGVLIYIIIALIVNLIAWKKAFKITL